MLKVDMEYEKGILYNYVVPVILKHRIKYLVFNLYDLESIDESGMDALLNAKCAIRTNKGKICLCEVSDFLREKMKRLRMKVASNELAAYHLINI